MSGEEQHDDMTMTQKFFQAEELRIALQKTNLASNDPKYQADVKSALLSFMAIKKWVDKETLFSENEKLSEIATPSIKFLLASYYVADLLLACGGVEGRMGRINAALKHFRLFLDQCETLKLMSAAERAAYRKGEAGQEVRETRDERIAAYKAEKERKEALEALRAKRAKQKQAEDQEDDQEDMERELYLVSIQAMASEAMKAMKFAQQELPMLEMMAQMKKDPQMQQEHEQRQKDARAPGKPQTWTLKSSADLDGPIPDHFSGMVQRVPQQMEAPVGQLSMMGPSPTGMMAPSPNGAAGIASVKNITSMMANQMNIVNQVFRDPNAPTMSEDDWFRDQQARGLLPTAPPPQASQTGRRYNHEEDDFGHEGDMDSDEEEAKVYKDRDWSNWTDDNEKGLGNRANGR